MKTTFNSKSDQTLQKALGYIYVHKNFHDNNFNKKKAFYDHFMLVTFWFFI